MAFQLSQLSSNLASTNRTNMIPSKPQQTSLAQGLVSIPVPPPPHGEETNLEASSSDESSVSFTIAHIKPSIMWRNESFWKKKPLAACATGMFPCGSSLREHPQIHSGVPFPSSQQGESHVPVPLQQSSGSRQRPLGST